MRDYTSVAYVSASARTCNLYFLFFFCFMSLFYTGPLWIFPWVSHFLSCLLCCGNETLHPRVYSGPDGFELRQECYVGTSRVHLWTEECNVCTLMSKITCLIDRLPSLETCSFNRRMSPSYLFTFLVFKKKSMPFFKRKNFGVWVECEFGDFYFWRVVSRYRSEIQFSYKVTLIGT